MPRNGSGTYSLPAGNPVVTGTTISSTVHNSTMNDLRDEMTNSVAKDGQSTMTGALKMGSNKISNVSNATLRTDAPNFGQYQDNSGRHAVAGGSANAITLTMSPAVTALVDGQLFSFRATNSNSGAVTVQVNATTAKDLTYQDGTALVTGDIVSGDVYLISYDSNADDYILLTRSSFSDFLLNTSAINSINEPQNVGFAASVATNHLTISLKGRDGNDPSASNPVYIPFRDETAATGTYDVIAVTSALSIVIEDGETLGHTEGTEELIYVYGLNNGGTVELAVAHHGIFDEGSLHSTTALSASADDSDTLYSTTARTSDPIQLLCVIQVELDNATSGSGNWDTAPVRITPWFRGMKRTGDIVQRRRNHDGTVATGSTIMPNDNTVPQNTEGNEYMTQAITPTSSVNTLRVLHRGLYSSSSADFILIAIFQDSVVNALAASGEADATSNDPVQVEVETEKIAGTTSSTTFKIRAGKSLSGTTTFNGVAGSQYFNGVSDSYLLVEEIQA